jgi:hypothetical protein
MTLKILSAIHCGYLLLGDPCQAIYDYDCYTSESINSTEFYKRLDSLLPSNALRYELSSNRRQSESLSQHSDALRAALLKLNKATAINEFFQHRISEYPSDRSIPDKFTGLTQTGTTAILTRSNGEAEWEKRSGNWIYFRPQVK